MIHRKMMSRGTGCDETLVYLERKIAAALAEGWQRTSDITITEGRARLGGYEHTARVTMTKEG